MIDMEIDLLKQSHEQKELVDRAQGVHQDLVEKAEAMFAPHVFDPTREKAKLEEVMGFVLQDCGAASPDQLLELVQKIDKVTRNQYPNYGLLDRIWILAQTSRARKAQLALERGP